MVALALPLLAEAHCGARPYTDQVELRRPFAWVRWGGALAGVALAVSTQAALWFEPSFKPVFWVVSLTLHAVILGLFLLNTRDFPGRRTWHAPVLVAQMLLGVPLTSDFWILNAIEIPLVRPPGRRIGWLLAQLALVPCSMAFLLWRQWKDLVVVADREKLWTQLYVQLGTALAESLAWTGLAYLAALLIVELESNRNQLISFNAELMSSRAMLAESSRAAERTEMARELHDSLGHHLTTLNLELELAQRVPAAERDGHVRQAQLLARLLLADLRGTVGAWRRAAAASGLPQALASLVNGVNGVKVTLEVDPDLKQLDAARAHALLRCAQEAVTNALRHSAARSVQITLRQEGAGVLLEVSDNGIGCTLLSPGQGLSGIAERAREFGGQASFDSPAAGGFRVQVRLPLEAAGA